jgi:xanthine dehydrogenase D subunit
MTSTVRRRAVRGGVGESVLRPDGIPKVTGTFAYVNDLGAEGMIWAATRRVRTPHARIARLDPSPAHTMPGVVDVITIDSVPGHRYQGQIVTDQPVLAEGEIRHWGEAIAVVAAETEEQARLAAEVIVIELEDLPAITDLESALRAGEVFRAIEIRRGNPDRHGAVVVDGRYEMGIQDQAPLGTEAGLAIPDGAGGVDIWGPTQWTHVDRRQIAACLALDESAVRIHSVGLGGAFGAREDLSLQTHLALLALRTGRPVKMAFDRTESFAAHVKRHGAVMEYRHEADRDGRLIRVEARILLDSGAYHMTSDAVLANSAYFALGPYRCERVEVDAWALRTNHPPAGAMRGFGANQPCFAVEAQMDRLAEMLRIDPVEIRLRNALRQGDMLPTTGQLIEYPLPTEEVIRSVAAIPLPDPDEPGDARHLPGGTGLTTRPRDVRRGVGYAAGIKNLEFSEGFDDSAEAEVELAAEGAIVHTAAIEVGQGMVTVLTQITRSALGIEAVRVDFDHTGRMGSAGSTSASRQTQMAGGAVLRAAEAVRAAVLARYDATDLDDEGVWRGDTLVATLADVVREGPVTERVLFRHPGTEAPGPDGGGKLHVDFCVAAHRAVVDVDPELGLVRVVRIDTAQDVGRALNPQSVLGQIEGGIAQGMGLAIMEELVIDGGVVRNPTFTDYLLPTALDMPDIEAVLVEEPSPWGPFGAKGFAELPTISSTPAVVAAIRAATGRALTRVPVRPQDIAEL